MAEFSLERGSPLPLGATVTANGVNFSIFSGAAELVTLALFSKSSHKELARLKLDPEKNKTGDIWHIQIVDLDHNEIEYGYFVDGPCEPENGHRFNSSSLLLDPYSRMITGSQTWGQDYIFVDHTDKIETRSDLRCAISNDGFNWNGDRHPKIPMEDLVIYELHPRGFTMDPSSGVSSPGTFRGLIEKLPYLKDLGVNAIELMPVHEFFETEIDRCNPENQERLLNYWGYSTISFFSPKASYAATGDVGGQIQEFKELVMACHGMGIEIILDVVFNHTAEGDSRGPSLSFRGLDNAIYYMLDDEGKYKNFSGCGNTLNCNHPVVREMIRDCLRYWVTDMHVDGFRFDLASILGRSTTGEPLSSPPLLEIIALDPVLSNVKLIAEAWDAVGLYQIGSFPAWCRWGEWNGKYRDSARRFLKGDVGHVGELATRISGSPDLYKSGGRSPYHSINLITCHDGFPLADLFAYNEKHNLANGEENRDGGNDNWSYNHGHEGITGDEQINSLRRRQMKNAIVLLLISQGVPMLYEGDELCRSKNGNNNTYCHDNSLNWIDWTLLEENNGFHRFVKGLISFRKFHQSLRRDTFFTGELDGGNDVPDITWHGLEPGKPDWSTGSKSIAFTIGGHVNDERVRAPDIYVAFNSEDEDLIFETPQAPSGRSWWRVVDTAQEAPHDYLDNDELSENSNGYVTLISKSSQILIAR